MRVETKPRASIARGRPGLDIVFAVFYGVLLVAVAPYLLVQDSWLTLVAGREIAEHGLPGDDQLTILGVGTAWVDQQWLAHLAFYGLAALGGVKLAAIGHVAALTAAFALAVAAARTLGASLRAVLPIAALYTLAAPWSLQLRAQSLAYPLFVALLWLLVRDPHGTSRRTLLAFPILIVWANLHGSVVLGALLATAYGATCLLARRRARTAGTWPSAIFLLAPAACVLVSPYALDLPGYYNLMLVDAPFAEFIEEWGPASPRPLTAVFYVFAAVTVAIALVRRRELRAFEGVALALTLVGAVVAVRGVVWFALAALIVVPRLWSTRDQRAGLSVRAGLVAAGAAVGAVAAVAAFLPASYYEDEWPTGSADAVEAELARDPAVTVFADERHADWLLWAVPELRGRLAYDVRFELYEPAEIRRLVALYSDRSAQWEQSVDGFDVVVLDPKRYERQAQALRAPRSVVFEDERTLVLVSA